MGIVHSSPDGTDVPLARALLANDDLHGQCGQCAPHARRQLRQLQAIPAAVQVRPRIVCARVTQLAISLAIATGATCLATASSWRALRPCTARLRSMRLRRRDNEAWAFQRKVAVPMFHKKHLDEMVADFVEHGHAVLDVLKNHARSGTALDVEKLFMKYSPYLSDHNLLLELDIRWTRLAPSPSDSRLTRSLVRPTRFPRISTTPRRCSCFSSRIFRTGCVLPHALGQTDAVVVALSD